jgi:hypothetical protein
MGFSHISSQRKGFPHIVFSTLQSGRVLRLLCVAILPLAFESVDFQLILNLHLS